MPLAQTSRNKRPAPRAGAVALIGALFSLGWTTTVAFGQAVETEPVRAEPNAELVAKIDALKKQAEESPQDAKVHFLYGKSLLAAGNRKQAAFELLESSALEPQLYVAYHQLTLCKPSKEQLDEAIERLTHLKKERPKELMLRVALSEVLEQRNDCYSAARTLLDLVYAGDVPAKLLPKVQARIHYLLSQTTSVNVTQATQKNSLGLDDLPVPTPEAQLKRGLATGRGKDASGFGHSKLLP